jgi:hypothetical protein
MDETVSPGPSDGEAVEMRVLYGILGLEKRDM